MEALNLQPQFTNLNKPSVGNPSGHQSQCRNAQNQQKNMEKFQQLVMKLFESEPNKPLTASTRSIVQKCLDEFCSKYRTPEHPPYAAMIEKALHELNEKEGSSEDSISKFIQNEFDNLPWAHSSLLKNHLEKLCQRGEIVMTGSGRYLLPRSEPRLGSKEHHKKKQGKRKKNGPKGDKTEVIGVQRINDGQGEVSLKTGVLKIPVSSREHKQKEEDHGQILLSFDNGGNCYGSDSQVLTIEPPRRMTADEECLEEVVKHQQGNFETTNLINISVSFMQEQQGEYKDCPPITLGSERPPGFESIGFGDVSCSGDDRTGISCAERRKDSLDFPISSSKVHVEFEPPRIKAESSLQAQKFQHSPSNNQIKQQQSHNASLLQVPLNYVSGGLQHHGEMVTREAVELLPAESLELDKGKGSEILSLEQVSPSAKARDNLCNKSCEQVDCIAQEPVVSEEELQPPGEGELAIKFQQNKKFGRRRKKKSQKKEMASMNLEQTIQESMSEPNKEIYHKPLVVMVEPQQRETYETAKLQSERELSKEQGIAVSVPEEPMDLDLVPIKDLLQSECIQMRLRRRKRKLSKPKVVVKTIEELLHSSTSVDQDSLRSTLPSLKGPQYENETPVQLPDISKQRMKVYSKKLHEQPETSPEEKKMVVFNAFRTKPQGDLMDKKRMTVESGPLMTQRAKLRSYKKQLEQNVQGLSGADTPLRIESVVNDKLGTESRRSMCHGHKMRLNCRQESIITDTSEQVTRIAQDQVPPQNLYRSSKEQEHHECQCLDEQCSQGLHQMPLRGVMEDRKQQQADHGRQGTLPKAEQSTRDGENSASVDVAHSVDQPAKPGYCRHPNSTAVRSEVVLALSSFALSPKKGLQEEQPKHQRLGRPPTDKKDTVVLSLRSSTCSPKRKKSEEQQLVRRVGRPPKHQVNGRPPKPPSRLPKHQYGVDMHKNSVKHDEPI